jgi:hypothetical protein
MQAVARDLNFDGGRLKITGLQPRMHQGRPKAWRIVSQ